MILIAFGLAIMNSFLNVIDGGHVMKIYCEVNKSNEVKSPVTLDKTTLLQVKVFSQNSPSLHANYVK